MTAPPRIVQAPSDPTWRSSTWRAFAGDEAAGSATAWVRPDGRCFVSFASCPRASYGPLLEAVAAAVGTDLHVTVNGADEAGIALFQELRFRVNRRERSYVVPVDEAVARLSGAEPPPGVHLVTSDAVEERRLRELDDVLRQDVPGTDGWRWTADAFRDEMNGPHYDPALYAVAVDADEYVGLARVWKNPRGPRLGMIGVVRSHRRRGIARALLADVFAVLHERGIREVETEADVTNVASTSLLTGLGGVGRGVSIELVRSA